MQPLILALNALALSASPTAAVDIVVMAPVVAAFEAPKVAVRELDHMRGGIQLPNGLDLSVGIDIQTRVDGILVLHSIYATDGPFVGTRLFTDGAAEAPSVPASATITVPGGMSYPVISISRGNIAPNIAPGNASSPTTVNLIADPQANWVPSQGQELVGVSLDSAPVTTDAGDFRLATAQGGAVAVFTRDDLEIRHLIGQATGVVVANTGNDRTIDTVSAVNIELRGAEPLLAASQFIASALALDASFGR